MPTRDTAWPEGTPCWVDIGVPDIPAAREFYSALLGWEYTGGDPEFGGYLTATKNGENAAGMGPQQDPDDPPRWTTYFATDDAAATAAKIRDAGGTVLVEPMEVGPMGTMLIALDPQGLVFGAWQSGQHTGCRIYNESGALSWNEAMTADSSAARQFYTAVFGFTFDQLPPEQGGEEGMDYTTFAKGANPLGGLGGTQEGMPTGWLTCFGVDDADAAVATIESKGGKVTVPPMDTPFGRFAIVEDPWGAAFEVMGPTSDQREQEN
jgi:predicted enzyme related to lactoylglutathione lyase